MPNSTIKLNGTTLMTVNDTTATAADVASGKLFYTADGTQTTGTASGGGGAPILGVLRPDAELVKRFAYDKLVVSDLGVTLPSYVTSAQTLVASSVLETLAVDYDTYSYGVVQRLMANPIYSTSTKGSGRAEYYFSSYYYETVRFPTGFLSIDGKQASNNYNANATMNRYALAYWSGASTLNVTATQNGAYAIPSTPTMSSSTILSISSPAFNMKGNGTYFNSTYWGYTTDIRAQYIIEVYRTPKTPMDGFAITSMMASMVDDIETNGGTLT